MSQFNVLQDTRLSDNLQPRTPPAVVPFIEQDTPFYSKSTGVTSMQTIERVATRYNINSERQNSASRGDYLRIYIILKMLQ